MEPRVEETTDLVEMILSDTRPMGHDGCSNADRAAYICEVFDCEHIDLTASYDFTNINACKDLDYVVACKHLALLKMAFIREAVDYSAMEPMAADINLQYLTLAIQRINWHIRHLAEGKLTPPFPGIH